MGRLVLALSILILLVSACGDPGESREETGGQQPESASRVQEKAARPVTGNVGVAGTGTWDGDGNVVAPKRGADLQVRHAPDPMTGKPTGFLEPQGRAKLAVLPNMRWEDTSPEIGASADFKPSAIRLREVADGTVLALRTDEGRVVFLRIVKLYDMHDFSFPGGDEIDEAVKQLLLGEPNQENYHVALEWLRYPE